MMGDERRAWIDVARGTCIILVTLLHTTFVVDGAVGSGRGIWPPVDYLLHPLRMPLFFFISGMLAAGAVARPLRQTRRRTLGLLYLYVLWSVLQLVHLVFSLRDSGDPLPEPYDVVASFFAPTGLWFLWALATYFLLARLLHRLLGRFAPWALVPLAALSMLSPVLEEMQTLSIHPGFGAIFLSSVYSNAVWYFAGLYGRWAVRRLRAVSTPVLACLAVAVFWAAFEASRLALVTLEVRWLLSGLAVVASLMVFAVLPLRGVIARTIAAVGRRTLPIYVMQWYLMHLLAILLIDVVPLERLGHQDLVASVITPLLTAAVIAVSCGIGGMAATGPLSWLFSAPRWLVGASRASSSDALGGRAEVPGTSLRQARRILRR